MLGDPKSISSYLKDNNIGFVKLMFCDLFGTLKNITVSANEFSTAFVDGIGFDASSIKGFLNENESDLFLYPDISNMRVYDNTAYFFCTIKTPGGKNFEGDLRILLKSAVEKAEKKGYSISIGAESEFHLFNLDENGNPTLNFYDDASYFTFGLLDKGDEIRKQISYALNEFGLNVQYHVHEKGKSQHEIVFKYSDPVTAADNFILFKSIVKDIAKKNGIFASFMPKPLKDTSGNGLHINISIKQKGENIFERAGKALSPAAQSFIAGIFKHINAMTAFLNPLINSYKRLNCGFEAPKYVSWGFENRSQLVRIPSASLENSRMELRSPDPSCNPYIAFLLLIEAGIEGIIKEATLESSGNIIDTLPLNLYDALGFARSDKFIEAVIGKSTFEKYITEKINECDSYNKTIHTWEIDNYFRNI